MNTDGSPHCDELPPVGGGKIDFAARCFRLTMTHPPKVRASPRTPVADHAVSAFHESPVKIGLA